MKHNKGFTLIELLIYASILAVAAGLIGGIVYITSRSSNKTQVENALSNQMRVIEEYLKQNIEKATNVNSASGSDLSLATDSSSTNPIIFSLSSDVMYVKQGTVNPVAINDSVKVKVTSLTFTLGGATGSGISSGDHYAWNDQVGWLDFACNGCNVEVPIGAGDLKGMASSVSDSGYLFLNCISADSCSTINYKVSSDANGNLSGWGWSDTMGWVSFNCSTDSSCGSSNYKVTIASSTGEFDGYAYSENMGWISFNCKTGGNNQADICSTSPYKVKDLRLKKSAVKVDVTLMYNDSRPEYAVTRSATFLYNLLNTSE